jgi:NADH-quinone oxidoreductase subunit L
MVTAGVFLVVRMSPLFEQSSSISDFMLIIGSLTCVLMAMIAVTHNDIKKIIAYSTSSQLGYMFMACGAYYYNSAIFHLATHAFFKALLFLCAGNIIYMTHEQDLNKLGGLFGKMKITFILFIIGALALIGMYPFAGYYSKDLIIENLSHNDRPIYQFAYVCSLCGVFFTSLYSSKLLIKIFFGKNSHKDAKEAPSIMTLPLMILAFGSIFAGIYGVYILNIGEQFFSNSMVIHSQEVHPISSIKEIYPTIIVILGLFTGSIIYTGQKKKDKILKISNMIEFFKAQRNYENNFIYRLFKNKLYFDEIYNVTILYLVKFLAICFNIVDNDLIDNQGPGRSRKIIKSLSLSLSKIQNGYIYFYYTISMVGIISALSWIIIIRY